MPQPSAPSPELAEHLPLVLSPTQLADVLGLPLKTIYLLNASATGPTRMRVGKHVRYRREDVTAWLAQRAEAGAA